MYGTVRPDKDRISTARAGALGRWPTSKYRIVQPSNYRKRQCARFPRTRVCTVLCRCVTSDGPFRPDDRNPTVAAMRTRRVLSRYFRPVPFKSSSRRSAAENVPAVINRGTVTCEIDRRRCSGDVTLHAYIQRARDKRERFRNKLHVINFEFHNVRFV